MAEFIKNLLFVPKCRVCGKPADKDNLCESCAPLLARRKNPSENREAPVEIEGIELVFASYYYDGAARDAVVRAKFVNPAPFLSSLRREISPLLERILSENDIYGVIPAPFYPSKLYKKEYDLSLEIAKRIAGRCKVKLLNPIKKTVYTPRQHSLPARQRKKNLDNAFVLVPGAGEEIKGKNLLLTDDVITTGSTMKAMASLLKKAGRGKLYRWAYTYDKIK